MPNRQNGLEERSHLTTCCVAARMRAEARSLRPDCGMRPRRADMRPGPECEVGGCIPSDFEFMRPRKIGFVVVGRAEHKHERAHQVQR